MIEKHQLAFYTGTETWWRYSPIMFPYVLLTDGMKFVAEHGGNGGAYWLCDIASSHLSSIAGTDESFFIAVLKKRENDWLFRIVDDLPPGTIYAEQVFPYSDFDLHEFKFYIARQPKEGGGEDWIFLSPSEY